MSNSSSDIQSRFDALQRKLVPLWESIGRSTPGSGGIEEQNTVVVVPSMSIDTEWHGSMQQAYEERFLFMLFLLRQPDIRLIYVTSQEIRQSTIDYYLQILPGAVISSARKRLFLVAPLDASSATLSEKLLARPRLIKHIQSLIPDMDRAHLVPYNTTDTEKELALQLGIPMYAADPEYFAFGTKSGSRRMFIEEGVPHPLGYENLKSVDELVAAIAKMRAQRPTMRKAIVKLNEGVSGEGNAVLSLESLPKPGDPGEAKAIVAQLHNLRYELPTQTYDVYVHKLAERGGIVEEMIAGTDFHSPSTQLRITPLGQVDLLSTHDQMLGGPSGQSYLGCRFPANTEYGPTIMREAAKVGKRFAREGIVGRFALDFVSVRGEDGQWQSYAIEINLRKGGTTHPFLTLAYLTDGAYDAENAVFRTARGNEKAYVATDHLQSDKYKVFTSEDLFDIVSRHRLHFDHTTQTGIVLHMLPAIADLGSLGFTAIGDTHEQANALYARMAEVLELEANAALERN
jgi:pheganomycin biosynthesis PGM1-like protein